MALRLPTGGGVFSVCAVAVAIQAAGPREALAQDKTFYLDRLQMSGAPDDPIGLWRPEQGTVGRVYGQLGVGFALNPLRVENHIEDQHDADILSREEGAPVTSQLIGYFDAGVQLFERFGVGVELPVIAAQSGNATSTAGIDAPNQVDMMTASLMDVRLDGRVLLLRTQSRMFKLGGNVSAWLPTGNEYSWAGDSTARGGFGLSGELDMRRFFVVMNSGLVFRPRGGVNDLIVESEWRWGAGAFLPLRDGALRLGAQVLGATGITERTFFAADNTPLEWMVEARLATDEKKRGWIGAGGGTRLSAGFAPDVRVVAVAGYTFGIADTDPRSPGRRFRTYAERGADTDRDGLPDDIDLCPNEPEDGKPPNHDDGCPTLPDRDQDGIPDISDQCPDVPEDLDGIRDGDGCPEDDGDRDGVPDAVDACPKVAGAASPAPDRNGCPRGIGEGQEGLFLLQQVQFETGKARILPESFPILDEVVKVLKGNPDADRVTVEGHTDNTGPAELNERLSADRARSVMRYLIEHGIEAERVSAKGFGPRIPIGDNATPEGRKKNRRVEFKLSADIAAQPNRRR